MEMTREQKIKRAIWLVIHADLVLAKERKAMLAELKQIKADLGIKKLSEVTTIVNDKWVPVKGA